MGSFSLMHWIVVALLVVLLFGRGKISAVMGDFAKGINAFKRGMKEGSEEDLAEKRAIDTQGPTIDGRASETKSGSSNV